MIALLLSLLLSAADLVPHAGVLPGEQPRDVSKEP